jgi:hypothetical protein
VLDEFEAEAPLTQKSVCTFMPGSALREQAGTSVRDPSTSTSTSRLGVSRNTAGTVQLPIRPSLTADWTAEIAVWPSPQIEASRATDPMSPLT